MGEGNQGVLTAINQNEANKFETKYKEFKKWVAKQSLTVETAVTTVMGALEGATTGFVLNTLFESFCSRRSIPISLDPKILSWAGGYKPLVESMMIGSSLEQARNFAVVASFNKGITCVMKRLRGKEDIQTRMAASFGCGAMLSLVTGMRGPSVVSVGVIFALADGGLFKLEEKFPTKKADNFLEKGSLTNIKQRYESFSAFQDEEIHTRVDHTQRENKAEKEDSKEVEE